MSVHKPPSATAPPAAGSDPASPGAKASHATGGDAAARGATQRPLSQDNAATPAHLRNPDPPVATPATRASARILPGGSVASNGYWLHDAAGPRHYVGPHAAAEDSATAERLIAAVEDRLAALPDLDTRRVHLALEGVTLRLTGFVPDAETRRRVGSCTVSVAAAAAPNLAVANHLAIGPADAP